MSAAGTITNDMRRIKYTTPVVDEEIVNWFIRQVNMPLAEQTEVTYWKPFQYNDNWYWVTFSYNLHQLHYTTEDEMAIYYTPEQQQQDWSSLIFYDNNDDVNERVRRAIANPTWQRYRLRMMGAPLVRRFSLLQEWLRPNLQHLVSDEDKRLQVTNYVNTLRRMGRIK